MVTLRQGCDCCFDCYLKKEDIKNAIKSELYNSFEIKTEANIDAMTKYLVDHFFWELFHHFNDELCVVFGRSNISSFGGEFL